MEQLKMNSFGWSNQVDDLFYQIQLDQQKQKHSDYAKCMSFISDKEGSGPNDGKLVWFQIDFNSKKNQK